MSDFQEVCRVCGQINYGGRLICVPCDTAYGDYDDDEDDPELAPCGHAIFDMRNMAACPVCGARDKGPIEESDRP